MLKDDVCARSHRLMPPALQQRLTKRPVCVVVSVFYYVRLFYLWCLGFSSVMHRLLWLDFESTFSRCGSFFFAVVAFLLAYK